MHMWEREERKKSITVSDTVEKVFHSIWQVYSLLWAALSACNTEKLFFFPHSRSRWTPENVFMCLVG